MGNKASKKDSKSKNEKEQGDLLQICNENEESINCMELSEDGTLLVTGSDDGIIRIDEYHTIR